MKIEQREFSGESDKQAMIALTNAFPADNLHIVDLPYRLSSWALDYPNNIKLWVNSEGQLLAWAVMQTPFWTIDYVCHPHTDPNLHRQILDWADKHAQTIVDTSVGHPAWYVNVFPSQTDRICHLEEAGFVSQSNVGKNSWHKLLMQCLPQTPVASYTLPTGFNIRPLAGEQEIEAYVYLHRAVFESKNMTVEWRKRILHSPEYLPDLDLVAVAPDGRLAAFCVCWLNKQLQEPHGQIEPLGVHHDYRKLGLGRAILLEGLNRLQLHGAAKIYVETDKYRNDALGLYEAVGFRLLQDVLVYRKDYN